MFSTSDGLVLRGETQCLDMQVQEATIKAFDSHLVRRLQEAMSGLMRLTPPFFNLVQESTNATLGCVGIHCPEYSISLSKRRRNHVGMP
jgi:hypothetical protein